MTSQTRQTRTSCLLFCFRSARAPRHHDYNPVPLSLSLASRVRDGRCEQTCMFEGFMRLEETKRLYFFWVRRGADFFGPAYEPVGLSRTGFPLQTAHPVSLVAFLSDTDLGASQKQKNSRLRIAK